MLLNEVAIRSVNQVPEMTKIQPKSDYRTKWTVAAVFTDGRIPNRVFIIAKETLVFLFWVDRGFIAQGGNQRGTWG